MLRDYDHERDAAAVHRIWREVGWLEAGDEAGMDEYVACSKAHVAELNGEAECLVLSTEGSMRYLDEDLPAACISGVTTSRVARRQGFATRLMARSLAEDARCGKLVSALGMFEQGFYNQVGFGTAGYERILRFDPLHLRTGRKARVPIRVTKEDWEDAHRARLRRLRRHGGMNLLPAGITRSEMKEEKTTFGLGYRDGTGKLTHLLWVSAGKNVEDGPYRVMWMVYRSADELLELLALIEGLSAQVQLVAMPEPPGVQLQDMLHLPLRHTKVLSEGRADWWLHAVAYCQFRILDLPGCIAKTRLDHGPLRFNLQLVDPVERYVEETGWRGAGGQYVVTLGERSAAEPGERAGLPALRASVGAFTRMWLGVRPASGLAVTDEIAGPAELLDQLDRTLCLPEPRPDWDF